MYLYEVVIGLSKNVVADRYTVKADSFKSASDKAYRIFKARREQYSERDIISISQVGELVEP